MSRRVKVGLQLRIYLCLRPLLQPLMYWVVRRRVARGKDDPVRCKEKFGLTDLPRPKGTVIWVHAVGLGEVLALRPLLTEMRSQRPDIQFVITSTARSSAQVIKANLPPNAVHQFLPLDGPRFVRRFLDHWRPALSVWSEQDFWPGAIYDAAARGISLAYINARINAESFAKRKKLSGVYRDLLDVFAITTAQDSDSAAFLRQLGAANTRVFPSLKPAAAPLEVNETELQAFRDHLKARNVWVAASTHVADEAVVLAAQSELSNTAGAPLLILAPRVPDRASEIKETVQAFGLSMAQRSRTEMPQAETSVYVADSFGELGLWYRLADIAFVGASFGSLGGHNPWEPARLGLSVLHGPNTQNFAADYRDLGAAGVTHLIDDTADAANEMARAVADAGPHSGPSKAAGLVKDAQAALVPLARDLLSLIKGGA